jgi:hypothetical protein
MLARKKTSSKKRKKKPLFFDVTGADGSKTRHVVVFVKSKKRIDQKKFFPKKVERPKAEAPTLEKDELRAIKEADKWVQQVLSDFVEPVRVGVRKGDAIGFSKTKKRAALLTVLYPSCLDLKGLAKISHVSLGVLQLWRTEENFQKEIEGSIEKFSQTNWDVIDNYLTGYENYKTSDPQESNRLLGLALKRLNLLRFFNPAIFESLMARAGKKIGEGHLIYAVFAPGQFIHTIYQARPFKTATRKFLMARRILIEEMIEKLADPQLREKNSEEEIQAFAETIQKEVGDTFYILLEEIDYGSEKARREQFETGKSNSTPDRRK